MVSSVWNFKIFANFKYFLNHWQRGEFCCRRKMHKRFRKSGLRRCTSLILHDIFRNFHIFPLCHIAFFSTLPNGCRRRIGESSSHPTTFCSHSPRSQKMILKCVCMYICVCVCLWTRSCFFSFFLFSPMCEYICEPKNHFMCNENFQWRWWRP